MTDCVYTVRTVKLYGPVCKAKTVVDYLVFFLLCKHIMVIPGRPAPNNRPQPENGLDAVSPQTNKETRVHLSQSHNSGQFLKSNILFFLPFQGKRMCLVLCVFFS